MAAPSLDTDHPGLRVLAEVATILASGLGSDQALTGIVDALRRGLVLRRCCLWLRSADGASYTAVTTQGDDPPAAAAPAKVADWMRAGPQREDTATGVVMRLPLIHEDVAEIVESHILNDLPVSRLTLKDECINTVSCEHKRLRRLRGRTAIL